MRKEALYISNAFINSFILKKTDSKYAIDPKRKKNIKNVEKPT